MDLRADWTTLKGKNGVKRGIIIVADQGINL